MLLAAVYFLSNRAEFQHFEDIAEESTAVEQRPSSEPSRADIGVPINDAFAQVVEEPKTTVIIDKEHSVEAPIDVVDSAQSRSQQLRLMFNQSPRGFAQKADNYLSQGLRDDHWSPIVETDLTEWFGSELGEGDELFVECVSDACYMDLYVSTVDFIKIHLMRARQWSPAESNSLLPTRLYVRDGRDYYRFYFFRVTFDLDNL